MKPLIPVLVVATTSLAVASVQFARQASAQRERAEAELAHAQKSDARIAELERNQARLERELFMVRGRRELVASAPTDPARPMGPRPPGAGPGVGAAMQPGEPGAPPPPFEMRGRGPLDSPAGRNFMRSRAKSSIRRLYEDAGTALGLSPEKSNQLLDLLADQQTRNFGRPQIPDGETPQQYFQDQQKKNADEIRNLIGADKVAAWEDYQKSLPSRAQLNAVRDQLDQAGTPMTDSQRTQMLAAITEESQRLPRPTFTAGLPQEEMVAQINQWQTEYDKALLDRAQQVLTTEQYNAYKEYQDWQTEMRNSLPRGPRVFMQGGAPGAAVSMGNVVIATPFALQAVPTPPQPTPRK